MEAKFSELRTRFELKQQDIAIYLNVSVSCYQKIEYYETLHISFDHIVKLSILYDVRIDYLMGIHKNLISFPKEDILQAIQSYHINIGILNRLRKEMGKQTIVIKQSDSLKR